MVKIIKQRHCKRCFHEWYPRNPAKTGGRCPKCNSYYWDQERIRRPLDKKGE
ncbi:hypothetical protein LCGC14_0386520 [marine sediment metagenome]|uniref:Uncharacterized protein n=1 Tax=marine sediment metagenome TaxID=412755 RepID=A0A0F9W9X7_9ZZZZ